MNAKQNMKSGSSIEQQIQSIPLSQHRQKSALHAASIAETFVNAIVWVCGKAQGQNSDMFAKPNLKY